MNPVYGLIAKVVMLQMDENKNFLCLNQNLRDYTLKDCCIRKMERNLLIMYLLLLCETVQGTCVLSQ